MRRPVGALLLFVLLCGATNAPPSVDEIVRRHIEAIGGAQRWQKVQTLLVKGTGKYGSFLNVWKYPDRVRTEERDSERSQKSIITAFDGTTGWMINQYKSSSLPHRMDAADLRNWETGLILRSDLLDLPARGTELKFLGYDTVNGRIAYKLSLKRPNRDEVRLWIDRESFLLVQRAREVMAPWGEERTATTQLLDYRNVEGVLIPHKVGTTPLTVEVNAEIDDALFRPPQALK
jgi:hypothetical protein